VSREVRLTRLARADLNRLVAFLSQCSPDAAMRAGVVIDQALRFLADQPDRGRPGGHPDLRELPIRFGRDGYIVRYRVEPGRVIVARIWHSRERKR
jgi:plasmid stabilization system protein ParE